MDRVEIESFWFFCPAFTDELVWRQSLECFQSSSVVIGFDEVIQVLFQLFMIVVVIPFDGCFLDRPVHALNLAIGPWVFDFCQSMINIVFCTDPIKDVNACIFVTGMIGELDTVVRQDYVDCIRNRFDQIAQKRRRCHFSCLLHQLDKSKLRCAVNGDKQIQLALLCADLSNINMKITNRVTLEFLLRRFVSFHVWQTGDAMTLQTTVQR